MPTDNFFETGQAPEGFEQLPTDTTAEVAQYPTAAQSDRVGGVVVAEQIQQPTGAKIQIIEAVRPDGSTRRTGTIYIPTQGDPWEGSLSSFAGRRRRRSNANFDPASLSPNPTAQELFSAPDDETAA